MTTRRSTIILQRQRGESHDSWTRRISTFNREQAIEAKQRSGRWLPAEEYEKLTGRPGRRVPEIDYATRARDVINKVARPKRPAKASTATTSTRHSTADELLDTGKSALTGGALSAGMSVANDLLDSQRRKDLGGVARRAAGAGATAVAREGATQAVKYGIAKGLSAVAREGSKAALREGGKQVAKQSLRSLARGNAVSATACFVVDQGVDLVRLASGDIDSKEYGKRTVESGCGAAGAAGGAVAGAALGSVVPVVGTVVGGIIGGIIGGLGGNAAGKKIVR